MERLYLCVADSFFSYYTVPLFFMIDPQGGLSHQLQSKNMKYVFFRSTYLIFITHLIRMFYCAYNGDTRRLRLRNYNAPVAGEGIDITDITSFECTTLRGIFHLLAFQGYNYMYTNIIYKYFPNT